MYLDKISFSAFSYINVGEAVVQCVEHPAPDRIAWIRGSPGETLLYMLLAPGACKIRRGCNVLQVPTLNYTSALGYKSGGASPSGKDQNCNVMSPDHR